VPRPFSQPDVTNMAGEIEDDDEDMEAPLSDEGLEEFEGDGDDDGEVVLDPRERAARSLEIRRAIEARLEERRMRSDLDYLEVDDDEDVADLED
jgi:hypothetical protein